ncbi:MAG TPA: xanthine dehydrogenase family protein molybdopterin-binding subunit [Acidimicrobiia bacterium]|nr:xanthine dehydrogenase family protein molybdopterin-binding subunit [Acidimicrobiia bacterium]
MIGEPLRRLEDPRLITGRGRYVDDLEVPGVQHAVFVRSQEAHAMLRSIEFDRGDHPDATFFTASDLGVTAPMPIQNPSPSIQSPRTQAPLATEEVCYVGQPVALVIASSVATALDAAEGVFVDYEPLPASTDHRTALEEDATAAHAGSESNLAAVLQAGYGDASAVIAGSDLVVDLEFDQHRGALASLEGRGVLAVWDSVEHRLSLWTSSQAPHAVRTMVSGYLGMSPDDVRVSSPDVGGGFGPKAVVYPEEVVLAAAAKKLGTSVKWVERRREHFTASIQQRGQSGRIEAAYDPEGRILALRARLIHDLGAYVPYGVVVPMTTLRLMSGPYVIPNVEAQVSCVFTNKTPTGAIRGAGRPNATFLLERTMDAIAADLGLDRAEVRRRNLVSEDRMPYRVDLPASDGKPVTYDGGDYHAALQAALVAADLDGFEERRRESRDNGKLRGFGLAAYVEDTGIGPDDGARVEVLPDGEVLLETGVSSQGQGHATVFAQICAQHLGVAPEKVRVRSGDTDRYAQGVPTVASRTGQSAANAVHITASDLAETVKRLAAARLEAAPEDIVLENGVAMVVGQPGSEIPLGDLASASQAKLGGSIPEGQTLPGLSSEQAVPYGGSAFTYGTHVAEVEVDVETGHVVVIGYVVVHDCGTMLNPMIVEGQIDGGVAHGLGNALLERVVHDQSGQPLTASFMDYQIMTAADMPELTKIHMETPSPTNALGAKGAGEGGTIPAAAAVVSAIEHALGEGIEPITHYPVSAQWLLGAIRSQESFST